MSSLKGFKLQTKTNPRAPGSDARGFDSLTDSYRLRSQFSFRMNVDDAGWLPTRFLTPQLIVERKVPRKYCSPVVLFTATPDVACTDESPAALAHSTLPVAPSSCAVNASEFPADVNDPAAPKFSVLLKRPPIATLPLASTPTP